MSELSYKFAYNSYKCYFKIWVVFGSFQNNMKKAFLSIVVFAIATFPAYKALRHPGMITGHDAEAAVFRMEEFYNAIKDGQFPPRWAKRLNFGLGQPTFTFSYTMPYYLGLPIMAISNDPIWAYKMVLAGTFPAAAIFSWLWLKRKFGNFFGGVAGVLYAYAPYHFANVYARGAIGESVASALVPLTFWALDNVEQKQNVKSAAIAALTILSVILAHPFYGLVFSLIWLVYASKSRIIGIKTVIWGYITAAFYILPALTHKNSTHLAKIEDYFLEKQVFVDLPRLIYSPWGYAAVHETHLDPMTVQIGPALLVGLVTAMMLWKRRGGDEHLRLFVALAIAAIFMMLPISLPVWKLVAPLRAMQFPWRMLFVVNIATAYCVAFALAYFNQKSKRLGVSLALLLFATTLMLSKDYWHVQRYFRPQSQIEKTLGYPGTLTMLPEETPKWHSILSEKNPWYQMEIVTGKIWYRTLEWKTNYQRLEVRVEEPGKVTLQTHYWPGWEVLVNGKKISIFPHTAAENLGLIAFELKPGDTLVEARMHEPPINKFANAISVSSLMIIAGVLIFKRDESERSA